MNTSELVSLPDGTSIPLEPWLLILGLEHKGITLARDGEDLVARPRSELTDDDRVAIRTWKSELVRLVRCCEAVQ